MKHVEEEDLLVLLDHFCGPSLHLLGHDQNQILVRAITPAHPPSKGEQTIPLLKTCLLVDFDPDLGRSRKHGRPEDVQLIYFSKLPTENFEP